MEIGTQEHKGGVESSQSHTKRCVILGLLAFTLHLVLNGLRHRSSPPRWNSLVTAVVRISHIQSPIPGGLIARLLVPSGVTKVFFKRFVLPS